MVMTGVMRLFFLFLTAVALLAFSPFVHADTIDRLRAVVDQTPITSLQVDDGMRPFLRSSPDKSLQTLSAVQEEVLAGFVRRQLVLHDFKALEKKGANIPESIIDEIIQEDIRTGFTDRADFMKQLQQEGITVDDYRKNKREAFIVQQMTLANVSEPIISPHRIEVYYGEHPDDYKVPEQVKMRVITLVKRPGDDSGVARKRADEILLKIRGGASFDEMAAVYSDSKSTRDSGDPGWREVSKINKTLVEELRKLKPGECSEVIETPETCFLLLLQEWNPAHARPLGEVRDDIEKILRDREKTRLTNKWIERLKTKTFIKNDL
jgi:peptidyl-prolyl cis-trans isomerase SurA